MQTATETNGRAARAVADQETVLLANVTNIAPSPTQPRRHFAGIEELAETIKAHGIISPLIVRERQKKTTLWELVAGERRLRAARVAGLDKVPVIVRELSDKEVVEIQLVENCQRVDVHPLDEADAFDVLIKEHGYTAEELAAKIGKSVSYVYQRAKLTRCGTKTRDAFLAGKLDASRALLLARIPHEDLQTAALAEMLKTNYYDEPASYGECVHIVQSKFMLVLDNAPFDRASKTLVPAAGSCVDCDKRTGNQKALFGDVKSGDVCTDPKCHKGKLDAYWKLLTDEAKTNGRTVLGDREAKKIFSSYGGHLSTEGMNYYVDEAWKCAQHPKTAKWGQILAKSNVPRYLARDVEGVPHVLVDKGDAMKAARELGHAWARPEAKKKKNEDAAKEREKESRRKRMVTLLVGAVVTKIEASKDFTDAQWRALARATVRFTHQATVEDVLKRRAIPYDAKAVGERKLLDLAAKAKGPELRGLLAELVAMRGNAFELGPSLREVAEAFKVDLAKVNKESAKQPTPAKAPETKPAPPAAKKKGGKS